MGKESQREHTVLVCKGRAVSYSNSDVQFWDKKLEGMAAAGWPLGALLHRHVVVIWTCFESTGLSWSSRSLSINFCGKRKFRVCPLHYGNKYPLRGISKFPENVQFGLYMSIYPNLYNTFLESDILSCFGIKWSEIFHAVFILNLLKLYPPNFQMNT